MHCPYRPPAGKLRLAYTSQSIASALSQKIRTVSLQRCSVFTHCSSA